MKTIKTRKLALLGLSILVAGAALAARPGAAYARFHFGLVKSVPVDKATVATAPEVRLWFTEAPEAGSVSIRVLTARNVAVKTGEVAADKTDKKVYATTLPATLPNGAYSVIWRGMGDDGHVLSDTLTFTVAARH
jgi:copper resistance protein C